MATKPFNNALEIFKLLPQSNCRECGMRTCMAFAGGVFTGTQKLQNCPYLPKDIIQQYFEVAAPQPEIYKNIDKAIAELKEQIKTTDFSHVSEKLGGQHHKDQLTVKVLGKNFSVKSDGQIVTDIHVIPWVSFPVYSYIIRGGGDGRLTGKWVPLRELPDGKDWYRLFAQRCEKPLKKLADTYPDLFRDMVNLFSGQHSDPFYKSDISVILHPLPKPWILEKVCI